MARLDDFLIQLFHEGNCLEMYKIFGAHFEDNGVKGVRFTLYAPHAKNVQLIGDFNQWNGENHYMERYMSGGIFTLFVPHLKQYEQYKYRIETSNGLWVERADPYAFFSELRPGTASKVFQIDGFKWADKRWLNKRTKNFDKVLNIYEVNMGSWQMKKDFTDHEDGEYYSYEEMIDKMIPYIVDNGFSHVELMPLTEFPFDGSWGYQATGYFSATSRYGNPKQLMMFINACHKNNIGVIMDFVPAHFVKDGHGLYRFDGGYVYEYPHIDARYTEWDTCYFDLGKEEVRSFLMSSVHYWAEYFHIDGIRFDAISHLIYWQGQKERGINDGAIEFMKRMNAHMTKRFPGLMLIAEDSTDYPQVTRAPEVGGLGFDYKWDLGWMNDTLAYFRLDPLYRQHPENHHRLTFSMMYFYNENYILPFSHDEVVHSKGTILDKMWGDNDQKFAQCKALYLYMMTHPGKKLNFMGNELAEYKEWDEKKALGWVLMNYPQHASFHHYFRDLNHLIQNHPSLYQYDYYPEGFEWLVADDCQQSVYAYARYSPKGDILVCVMNFIGNRHEGYQIPVPKAGVYREVINTDKAQYAGNEDINDKMLHTKKVWTVNKENMMEVNIAPFAAMIFAYVKE